MKPKVNVSTNVTKVIRGESGSLAAIDMKQRERLRNGVDTIRPILESSVGRLKDSDWPSHEFAPYDIQIVQGDGVLTVSAPTLNTKQRVQGTLLIATDDPLRVEIGVELFNTGAGQRLGQAGAFTPSEIGAAILAHEIFHLSEISRMSASRVRLGMNVSPFAMGVHPEFGQDWMGAAFALAEHYRIDRGNSGLTPGATLAIWKAADLASEACADLQSLQILRRNGFDAKAWKAALIATRKADEAAAGKLAGFSSLHVSNPPYQIGGAIEKLGDLADSDDPWPIRKATWKMAFEAALGDKDYLPAEVRDLIGKALPNLMPKPASGRFQSFMRGGRKP